MRKKSPVLPEVEKCVLCGKVPVFVPLPKEGAAYSYLVVCEPVGSRPAGYFRGTRQHSITVSASSCGKRRITLRGAILKWNAQQSGHTLRRVSSINLTCRKCGAENLFWGKINMRYKMGRSQAYRYMLHEKFTGPDTYGYRVHKCPPGHIVSIKYYDSAGNEIPS